MEACRLIIPNYFSYSNEIKEEIIEDAKMSSAPLSTETDSIINSDSLEQNNNVNKIQSDDSQLTHTSCNRSRRKIEKNYKTW